MRNSFVGIAAPCQFLLHESHASYPESVKRAWHIHWQRHNNHYRLPLALQLCQSDLGHGNVKKSNTQRHEAGDVAI